MSRAAHTLLPSIAHSSFAAVVQSDPNAASVGGQLVDHNCARSSASAAFQDEFTLVSAAVAIQTEGDVISEIRIALGGVAHKPWRLIDVERALVGVRLSGTESRRALDAGFNAARPLTDNAFKIELSKRAVLRAVAEIGGLP